MGFERLILASGSPRRIELLRQLGLSFEAMAASLEEPPPHEDETPDRYAQRMAVLKASHIQNKLRARNAWVLGADTIVVASNQILGKPDSEDKAQEMLALLSDSEHSVITGFALLHQSKGIEHREAVQTTVRFRALTPYQINRYVKTGEPMDKAGAYGIQGLGAALVESINGCYFNVVGLPLSQLVVALESHNAGTLF